MPPSCLETILDPNAASVQSVFAACQVASVRRRLQMMRAMSAAFPRRQWLKGVLLSLGVANARLASAAGLTVATSLPNELAAAPKTGSPLLDERVRVARYAVQA